MVEAPTRIAPLGVAELVRRAGQALDRGLGLVWVLGEVAQVSRPASGHVYFTLKDAAAVVSAVMWRTQATRLTFALEAGQHLRVRGRLGIYDRDGRMQLYVDFAEPAGAGAEAAALEALTRKLAEEGLFADSRKRPLPRLPRRVGVVTSATGAAVRDIARTIERRGPIPILVADCVVQGASAPRQIVAALQLIARTDVDVIIVGRGGGSATDLAAFNDERVVRAIAACPVPVISAVGHEIDLTLADRVADQRASTPTAAAELAVPVIAELAAALAKEERRLGREVGLVIRTARLALDQLAGAADQALAIARAERATALAALERRLADRHPRAQLARRRAELATLERRLADRHPRLALAARRAALVGLERRLAARHPGARLLAGRTAIDQARARLDAALHRRRRDGAAALGQLAGRLDALSPLRVLDRGYALVSRGDAIVRSSDDVAIGDRLAIRLAHGGVRATVDAIDGAIDGGAADPPRPAPPAPTARAEGRAMSPRRATTRGPRRADTAIPIDDDQLVEIDQLAPPPRAHLAIHELTAGQLGLARAIALAGHHAVVAAGAGAAGIAAITEALAAEAPLDVILVALPGGEAIIDRARALGPSRPVVIASGPAPASATARDALIAGAELFTIRPHDPERLAPVLVAAARLADERRSLSTLRGTEAVLRSRLEQYGKADTATGFQRFEFFQRVLELELKRAKRYGYALSVLLLGQIPSTPAPPRDAVGTLRIRAAAAIARAVRDIDMPVEIGDDRFLVLLPYTDVAGAEQVARRAIAAVAAHPPVESGGRGWTTRVAGGVAGLRAGQPVSFAKLMKDAGAALRAAIEQRTDLVVIA